MTLRLHPFPVAGLVFGLAACAEGPPQPTLHRMGTFAGSVWIEAEGPDGGRKEAIELAFDRHRHHLQVQFRGAGDGAGHGEVVTLSLGGDGQVTAFEDAVERPTTAA